MKERIKILLLLIMIPVITFGQNFSYNEVKAKADKTLLQLLNEPLAAACVYDTGTYYSYLTDKGDTAWSMLAADRTTKGDVINIFTRYYIHSYYPKCSVYDSISGSLTLQFNNKMELGKQTDLSAIPEFALRNEGCHLLNAKEAKELAKKKYGLRTNSQPDAYIFYHPAVKQFTWTVYSTYYSDSTQKKNYTVQFDEIDASNGALVSQTNF